MIGRWGNVMGVFNLKGITKIAVQILIPYIAFGVVLLSNSLNGNDVSGLWIYALPIGLMIVVSFLSQEKQSKALLYFSVFGFVAMVIGLLTTGQVSIFAFICGGMACSVLWPCIFSLAIAGIGKYTSQGSSFLIMMIFGDAIIPELQGLLSDIPNV
jgi:FHS family L-fucose permease-like MFS transporter